MCGIAGIYADRAVEYSGAVKSMIAAMQHRGPDDRGIYVSPSGQCVLGHTRLAILDLSESAHQPMLTPGGDAVIAFNGEIYNYLDLRRQLLDAGETFTSSGDTEVLLRLLCAQDTMALGLLNGMFSFAFFREADASLLLARDPYGQKPLYYWRGDGILVFASELRALLASGLISRNVSFGGLMSFLTFGAVHAPDSIVEGVSSVLPGTCMRISRGKETQVEHYRDSVRSIPGAAEEQLKDKFVSAVGRHLMSDVGVGVFLSGGIDSSAIAAAAAAEAGADRLTTLCVYFPDNPELSERSYAKRMAEFCGSEHHEIPLAGSGMLSSVEGALRAMDQPTVDALNVFVVSAAAREAGLKVALSGLGGDELFGGYASFADLPLMCKMKHLVKLLGPWVRMLPVGASRFKRGYSKSIEWLESEGDMLSAYLSRRRVFTSRQIRLLFGRHAPEGWIFGLDSERCRWLRNLTADKKMEDAVALLELYLYTSDMLLRDSDVMGMSQGLEIRAPFLDLEFSDFALSLPESMRIKTEPVKRRLVEALGGMIPMEIRNRRKFGFALPLKEWMMSELKPVLNAGIESLFCRIPAMDSALLMQLKEAFYRDPESVGWGRLWALHVLGHFMELHNLRIP